MWLSSGCRGGTTRYLHILWMQLSWLLEFFLLPFLSIKKRLLFYHAQYSVRACMRANVTHSSCMFIGQTPCSPSGLTPLTFLSQPHLSSSPRVHALVTANATAAEDRACTKAASRVPAVKGLLYIRITGSVDEACLQTGGLPWFITLPKTLIPRGVVEQFQRRFLNWCWH